MTQVFVAFCFTSLSILAHTAGAEDAIKTPPETTTHASVGFQIGLASNDEWSPSGFAVEHHSRPYHLVYAYVWDEREVEGSRRYVRQLELRGKALPLAPFHVDLGGYYRHTGFQISEEGGDARAIIHDYGATGALGVQFNYPDTYLTITFDGIAADRSFGRIARYETASGGIESQRIVDNSDWVEDSVAATRLHYGRLTIGLLF